MKVLIAFLFACFVVGGLPFKRRLTIKDPAFLGILCFVVGASYLSLRVVL